MPFRPDHEGAGMVAALGKGVTGLRQGDPVGVAWPHDACGGCEHRITERTTYKGLKETEAKPGEGGHLWRGLGHIAIQHAKAMGLHVAAPDVTEDKLAMARALGAEIAVDATEAATRVVRETGGGTHGALVTAVSPPAFAQALSGCLRAISRCRSSTSR